MIVDSASPDAKLQRVEVVHLHAALADTKKLLKEAGGEEYLVRRNVEKLKDLQQHAENLANLTAVCIAVAHDASQTVNDGAVEFFLHRSKASGKGLESCFLNCIATLRAFALSTASVLKGMGQDTGTHDLHQVQQQLLGSFLAVRQIAFEEGAVQKLMQQGMDNFWALVYSLDEFLKGCTRVEAITLGRTCLSGNVEKGEPSHVGRDESQLNGPHIAAKQTAKVSPTCDGLIAPNATESQGLTATIDAPSNWEKENASRAIVTTPSPATQEPDPSLLR
jgi:hypothetical protein